MGAQKDGVFAPQLKGALDLSQSRASVNQALYNWIDVPRGEKVLCIERSLFRGLIRLCNVTGLESHGVSHFQALDTLAVPADRVAKAAHVMFLVRNTAANAQLVAQHICEIRRTAAGTRAFWVAVFPSVGIAFEKVLESAEMLADVHLDALPIHFLPFDTDTLTMLRPQALKELMADNNRGILHESAQALMELLRQHGLPKRIRAVGRNAVAVAGLLEGALKEASAAKPPLQPNALAALVLYDRETDLATPLLSQFTTEGVFDDAFDLAAEAGTLSWVDNGKPKHQVLNAKVEGWREIRLWPFVETLGRARAILEDIEHDVSKQRGLPSQGAIKTVARKMVMEAVVNKSFEVTETAAPMALWDVMAFERDQLLNATRPPLSAAVRLFASSDSKFADDSMLEFILQGASLEWCLRVMMLRVVCKGPFEEATMQQAIRLILDKFGSQHILTITNLQAAGVLPSSGHRRSPLLPLNTLFSQADKVASWRLFEPVDDSGAPASPTPYINYNPISARLVKHALQTYMPTHCVEHMVACGVEQGGTQIRQIDAFSSFLVHQDSYGHVSLERRLKEPTPAKADPDSAAVVIVMMLGGCTFGEMSAMRADAEKSGTKLVFLTTAIINGNSFVRSFIPDAAELATLDAERTRVDL